MKKIFHFLMFFATGLLVQSCSEDETEAIREAKTYAHALSVINEDYYELLVLNELSEPVTVASVNNLPYWLSVEAQEGVNKNGHPVLKLNVKKEDGMQEERQIEGTVTLSTGDIISLTVKQGVPSGSMETRPTSDQDAANTSWNFFTSRHLILVQNTPRSPMETLKGQGSGLRSEYCHISSPPPPCRFMAMQA